MSRKYPVSVIQLFAWQMKYFIMFIWTWHLNVFVLEATQGIGYKCRCKFGYENNNCSDVTDYCGYGPCENGATCTLTMQPPAVSYQISPLL